MTKHQAPMTKQIQNPKSKIQNAFALAVGVAGMVLAGCGPAAVAQPQPGAKAAAGSLEVVQAGPPVRKDMNLFTTQPARIEAIEQAPIHSRLAGYVGEVAVDYGDRVKKGAPLVMLDAPELDAEVAQKQALIEQARSEVAQAESSRKASEAALVTSKALVHQAEARLVKTRADVQRWTLQCERFKSLASSGSVNQQLVEEAENNCQAAEASHQEALAAIESAKAAVLQAEAEVAKSLADVEAAKARVRVAEANVAHAEALRSYATLKAPFDGVVTDCSVDPGHFVQPASASGRPLLVVARTDMMRILVAVPEIEAPYVDVGDEVSIEVQSLRGEPLVGKVTRTSVALDAGSRTLETIIDIENEGQRLRPGMYALAKLTLERQEAALTLPSAAVVRQDREAFCYLLRGGKAVKTPVELGIRVGDDWQITRGVAEGDTVILNKAASLKDGQPVELLK